MPAGAFYGCEILSPHRVKENAVCDVAFLQWNENGNIGGHSLRRACGPANRRGWVWAGVCLL